MQLCRHLHLLADVSPETSDRYHSPSHPYHIYPREAKYFAWHDPGDLPGSCSWAFGPGVKHEKVCGAGLRARRGHKLMVRRTHPTLNFSSTGFQPVHRTGKMPVPPKTFLFLVPKLPLGNPIAGQAPAWRANHLFIAPCAPSRSLGTRKAPIPPAAGARCAPL